MQALTLFGTVPNFKVINRFKFTAISLELQKMAFDDGETVVKINNLTQIYKYQTNARFKGQQKKHLLI